MLRGRGIAEVLLAWLSRKPKPRRLELRFVTYAEGDRLVKEGWTLAPEEDGNRVFGMVYLERLDGSVREEAVNKEEEGGRKV